MASITTTTNPDQTLVWVANDGGRKEAGYGRGGAGDCVTRAMALAFHIKWGADLASKYGEIWQKLDDLLSKDLYRDQIASPDFGMFPHIYSPILKEWGLTYTELPKRISFQEAWERFGDCIVRTNRHIAVLSNGQVLDTWDSRWRGTRRNLVRGVWQLGEVSNPPAKPATTPDQPIQLDVHFEEEAHRVRVVANCGHCQTRRFETQWESSRHYPSHQLLAWMKKTEKWLAKLGEQGRLEEALEACQCQENPEDNPTPTPPATPDQPTSLVVEWHWFDHYKEVVVKCQPCGQEILIKGFHPLTSWQTFQEEVANLETNPPTNLEGCQCPPTHPQNF